MLLMAVLKELNVTNGKVDVQGTVFYVAQEPWIFNGSIKQNILFGLPFNQKKFDEVTSLACLDQVSFI